MKIISGILIVLICTVQLFAQQTVTGTVTDGTEPLPVVNVIIKGTTIGVTTDLDGKFSIQIPEGNNVLEFSFVGFDTKEVTIVAGQTEYNIVLETGITVFNQTVVSASRRREKILDAPASVSVINAETIENNTALSAVDHIMYIPGVDRIQTGLVSSDVNIRGFNNIFSGAMLTIVDNRIARIPSLRVNAFQLIPATNLDLERIEIVRGPGSALYGPNAADGVFAMFTRSPLDLEKKFETTVSMAAGFRAKSDEAIDSIPRNRWIVSPEIWHGGKLSEKFGYKISGGYTQGTEFEHYDPREPEIGDTVIFGTVKDGKPFRPDTIFYSTTNAQGNQVDTFRLDERVFDRNFNVKKWNVDARVDIQPTKDIGIILSGGVSQSENLELTGLGAGQSDGWIYAYAQVRFNWKKLNFQYFLNKSNSNDTYLIPQVSGALPPHNVQLLTDKSMLHSAQIQHSVDAIVDKLSFIYGVDLLYTKPETDGTINGRFEDEDNILQIGGYLQGEYKFVPKFTLVAAARVDYHDKVDGVFISPRAALVYKPTPRHTIRGTYNRAFSPPTTLNQFLDLSNGLIPNGINIRGLGNPDGYDYRWDDQDMPMYISPYTGLDQWYSPDDNSNVPLFFDSLIAIIAAGLADQAPDNIKDFVPQLVESLVNGIAGDSGSIADVGQVFIDYVELLESGDFVASTYDLSQIKDAPPLKNSSNQTWEIGYKGIIKDKLFFTADFWISKQSDYVSPLVIATSSVMFNPVELADALGANNSGELLYDNVQVVDALLIPLLDGNPDYGDGVPNGTAYDEVRNIILGAAAAIPNGSITPDNDKVNYDVILIYRNLGDVTYGGIDLGFNYIVNKEFSLFGSYSFVNKDKFEMEGAEGGFVALNAPQHKASAALEYKNKKSGLGAKLGWRWQDAYTANSAIYFGWVEAANFLDLNVSYKLKMKYPKMILSFNVNNVLNNKHQRFPGTPEIGTIAMGKAVMTF